MLIKFPIHSFFILLILISSLSLTTSCSDDDDDDSSNIINVLYCENPFKEGEMKVNNESYFLESSFIRNGTDLDTLRRFDISGFTEDCERRDEVKLIYNLFNPGDLTGTYNISVERDSVSGNASGILLTQIVETLEQIETPLNSGSFTISDNEAGDLFISLEVETLDGDVVVIESPVNAN